MSVGFIELNGKCTRRIAVVVTNEYRSQPVFTEINYVLTLHFIAHNFVGKAAGSGIYEVDNTLAYLNPSYGSGPELQRPTNGVEMGAICDVYEGNLNAGLKAASTGAKPYEDYRRMLESQRQLRAGGMSQEQAELAAFEMNAHDQARVGGN